MNRVTMKGESPMSHTYARHTFIASLLFAAVCFAAPAFAVDPAAPCTVNINTATPAEIAHLVLTGPTLAAKIVEARTANAGKLTPETLDAVKGVGTRWLEYNSEHVVYEGATTCAVKLTKPQPSN